MVLKEINTSLVTESFLKAIGTYLNEYNKINTVPAGRASVHAFNESMNRYLLLFSASSKKGIS